ncbi:Hypothetical protein SRAE_2000487400 [Strongyloides ratti]|uniref:Decapping nuclease n=1 Tax=Strongyloides ratti TaxID=34506 RepID=A0A090N084_STRRB|nr:Hypothetical protein SRAE_2000487400 [Strongyloides ratti]CEF70240.1 Hypothetical protein SRAE_2000487400 [Strongyloides ratti]
MDTFARFRDIIDEPKKICGLSFNEYGEIMENETENQVFLNSNILKQKNIEIDLKKNFEFYKHRVGEFKIKFRSNMILNFHKRGEGKFKKFLNGADFFFTRGTLSAISNAAKDHLSILAIIIDGVIVVVRNEETFVPDNYLFTYAGLNFETFITSKNGNITINYDKLVSNWEQYKEIYTTNIYLSNGESIKIAYSCEIDAFDKCTMMPIEIKTQFIKNLPFTINQSIFGYFKSISVSFQCLLGNVHDVVVGYKNYNNIVCSIKKYSIKDILKDDSISKAVQKRCCDLAKYLKNIKIMFESKNNKGCFEIKLSNEVTSKYFSEILPEVKNFFTEEFCETFF